MQRDVRLTLALIFVKPSDDTLSLLSGLLAHLRAAGIRIKCVYADKGFCSIPVLRRLLDLGLPAIIATPIRGKQAGTRALCQGRRSSATSQTFRSAEHGELRVPVTVARSEGRQRSGRRRASWCVYVCLGVGGERRAYPQALPTSLWCREQLSPDGAGARARLRPERRCASC